MSMLSGKALSYLRLIGSGLAVAMALATFAGTASANPLTSPEGTSYTGTINAEAEGALRLDGSFTTVECKKSTVQGQVESHTETTASGKVSSLTFSECNFPVSVKNAGSLEIHAVGSGQGTLTSTGASIEITTSVGTCVFTTNGTHIGNVTDSNLTSGGATLDIGSAKIPRTGGNAGCGLSGTWTGSYKVTTPGSLFVGHPSGSASPLTSPAGTAYTGTIKAKSSNSKLDGSFVTVECSESTAEGKVGYHTPTSVIGGISSLAFGGCNYAVTVLKRGLLSLSTSSGAVTSTGAEISIATSVGTCVFATSGTSIGTLTDTTITKGEAVLDINSAKIPRTGGSFLCGSFGTWTGNYEVTTPSVLYLDSPAGLTSPAGAPYTSTLKAESEGAISFDGKFGTVSCQKSTFEGKVESHDLDSAGGKLSSWAFAECTEPVTVESTGSIEIHAVAKGEGTVTSSGAKISISTSVGTCVFTASTTDLGTLADSDITEGNATLDSDFAAIPRTGGSSSCGPSLVFTGSYDVTTPSTLYID
jgi:sporulation protein YlmC with PRC-barrel domain